MSMYISLLPRELQKELEEYSTPVKVLATRITPLFGRIRLMYDAVMRIDGRTYVLQVHVWSTAGEISVSYRHPWLFGCGRVAFDWSEDVPTMVLDKITLQALDDKIFRIAQDGLGKVAQDARTYESGNVEYWVRAKMEGYA